MNQRTDLAHRIYQAMQTRAADRGVMPLSAKEARARSEEARLNDPELAPWDQRRGPRVPRLSEGNTTHPGMAWDADHMRLKRRRPQRVHESVRDMIDRRSWESHLKVGHLVACWDELVGEQIAHHCRILNGVSDIVATHTLRLQASSTSWAQQLRLLKPRLDAVIEKEVGDLITHIVIEAPSQRQWRRGGRTVRGMRGPRDTYG